MGSGKMGQWFIGKIFLKSNSINEKISLKSIPPKVGSSTFHYSTIPLFHYSVCGAKTSDPEKPS
jgi:hypothetical protein